MQWPHVVQADEQGAGNVSVPEHLRRFQGDSHPIMNLDLNDLLRRGAPGTCVRVTIEVTVPDAGRDAPVLPPSDGQGGGLPIGPHERLQAFVASHGDGVWKEAEWGAAICQLDFSARELRRACAMGAIAWTSKGHGKDSGARLIHSSELDRYLRLRTRVLAGSESPPDWWSSVVVGRPAARWPRVANA